MFWMALIRTDNGNFTVRLETVYRAWLQKVLTKHLAAAIQRAYRHQQNAVFLYEALAARAADTAQRDIFRALAEAEKRQLARIEKKLQQLNASVPCEDQAMWGRFWRRFLLRCGPGIVLAYIQHVKIHDLRDQLRVIERIRSITSVYRKEPS